MAICMWCNQEMLDEATTSCSIGLFHRDGVEVPVRPYGKERRVRGFPPTPRCGDCGVARRGFHHPGCDLQECAICRGQAISCGCRFDEDGPPDPDDEYDDEVPLGRQTTLLVDQIEAFLADR